MWSFGTEARGYRNCDAASEDWGSTWVTDLGGTPIAVAAVGTDRVVYVDDTGTMTLLDAAAGAILWATEVGPEAGRPAGVGDTIFLVQNDDRLVAYPAATGAPAWDAPFGAPGLAPTAGSDVVYTAAGSEILAFDATPTAAERRRARRSPRSRLAAR